MSILTQPLMERAWAAYRRELPTLQRDYYLHWVAYYGERRVVLADTQWAVLDQLAALGIPEQEVLVQCVIEEPQPLDAAMFFGK